MLIYAFSSNDTKCHCDVIQIRYVFWEKCRHSLQRNTCIVYKIFRIIGIFVLQLCVILLIMLVLKLQYSAMVADVLATQEAMALAA